MPATTRAAKVPIPEAALLADLYGVLHDLDTAKEWCEKLDRESRQSYGDPWLNEALVTAAIIKYCRCFTSGVRFGLSVRNIEGIGAELIGQHEYFRALRDKFIAHPVNPFDESYVTISIREEGGVHTLQETLHSGHTRLMLSDQEATELIELINAVKHSVKEMIEKEKDRLLKIISLVPQEEWEKWDLHSPGEMKRSDVSKPRTRPLTKR